MFRRPRKGFHGVLQIICALLVSLFAGCAQTRSLVVLLPDEEGKVGAIRVQSDSGTRQVDRAYAAVQTDARQDAPPSVLHLEKGRVNTIFQGALSVEPARRYRIHGFTFYFLQDAVEFTPTSQQELPLVLVQLLKEKPLEIYVMGHADRLGSEAYNLDLSQRRARAVERLLVSSGVSAKIILISYYGESRPRVATRDEVQEPLNRRVELVVKSRKNE